MEADGLLQIHGLLLRTSRKKKQQAPIIFIFWDFLMFYQIFLAPQVKRRAIITYKHGIYELPNDLKLRILGN